MLPYTWDLDQTICPPSKIHETCIKIEVLYLCSAHGQHGQKLSQNDVLLKICGKSAKITHLIYVNIRFQQTEHLCAETR